MMPPLVIFSRSGVDVLRDESRFTVAMKARQVERRRHSPMWWCSNGLMAGLCFGYLVTVGATDAMTEWTQPSSLMALGSLIFAAGQLVSARMDDRRRITKLEETSATKEALLSAKESVTALSTMVERMDAKLDRLIERG